MQKERTSARQTGQNGAKVERCVLRQPRQFSTQTQFSDCQKAVFGVLERGVEIGAEVVRVKTFSRLNFDFCTTRVLNAARCKSRTEESAGRHLPVPAVGSIA